MNEEQVRQLVEQAEFSQEIVKLLLGFLSGAGVVIAFLFAKLLAAKDSERKAYQEVAPIATASLENAKLMDRVASKAEASKAESESRLRSFDKILERAEEVTKRLEQVERGCAARGASAHEQN